MSVDYELLESQSWDLAETIDSLREQDYDDALIDSLCGALALLEYIGIEGESANLTHALVDEGDQPANVT